MRTYQTHVRTHGTIKNTTESQTELYRGADLPGKIVFLMLGDERGHGVMERRAKANLQSLTTALASYEERIVRIAVGSTHN